MKIRVERFCLLATSKDWQTWLYEYDKELYTEFIGRLHKSRGCGDNREIMHEILTIIDEKGDGPELARFLRAYYPYMIIDDEKPKEIHVDSAGLDKLFGSGILTFPRRRIIYDEPFRLKATVQKFVSDKINYEFLLAHDKAYVEYLEKGEEKLVSKIPAKNWVLRNKDNANS